MRPIGSYYVPTMLILNQALTVSAVHCHKTVKTTKDCCALHFPEGDSIACTPVSGLDGKNVGFVYKCQETHGEITHDRLEHQTMTCPDPVTAGNEMINKCYDGNGICVEKVSEANKQKERAAGDAEIKRHINIRNARAREIYEGGSSQQADPMQIDHAGSNHHELTASSSGSFGHICSDYP